MTNMTIIPLSALRNIEIPGFIDFIVRVVEKENPEAIGVKIFFDELKNSTAELELLTLPSTGSKYTSLIRKGRTQVRFLCSAIIAQVKASSMANMTEHNNAVFVIDPLITKYLIHVYKSNWTENSKNINSFLLAVQSTEEMKNACETIGIDFNITQLANLKAQLDANIVLRYEEDVERLAVREQDLRKVVLNRVNNLLSAIELAKVTNKTFDFGPLTTAMNEGFSNYQALFRTRKTRNANKVIQKESAAPTTTSVATESFAEGA